MLREFFKLLKNAFSEKKVYESLEHYIISKNPQGPDDIDRLEREFWEKNLRVNSFNRFV